LSVNQLSYLQRAKPFTGITQDVEQPNQVKTHGVDIENLAEA